MNVARLLGVLFLVAAIASAVIGGAMYFESPKGALARLIGMLMLAIGGGGFGLLAIALLLGGPPRSRLQSMHRDTPFSRLRLDVGMLVGVIFGALSVCYALGALLAGEFPAGRGRGSAPTRLADNPGWFAINFIFFSGLGVGLIWLCLPPVLQGLSSSRRK